MISRDTEDIVAWIFVLSIKDRRETVRGISGLQFPNFPSCSTESLQSSVLLRSRDWSGDTDRRQETVVSDVVAPYSYAGRETRLRPGLRNGWPEAHLAPSD